MDKPVNPDSVAAKKSSDVSKYITGGTQLLQNMKEPEPLKSGFNVSEPSVDTIEEFTGTELSDLFSQTNSLVLSSSDPTPPLSLEKFLEQAYSRNVGKDPGPFGFHVIEWVEELSPENQEYLNNIPPSDWGFGAIKTENGTFCALFGGSYMQNCKVKAYQSKKKLNSESTEKFISKNIPCFLKDNDPTFREIKAIDTLLPVSSGEQFKVKDGKIRDEYGWVLTQPKPNDVIIEQIRINIVQKLLKKNPQLTNDYINEHVQDKKEQKELFALVNFFTQQLPKIQKEIAKDLNKLLASDLHKIPMNKVCIYAQHLYINKPFFYKLSSDPVSDSCKMLVNASPALSNIKSGVKHVGSSESATPKENVMLTVINTFYEKYNKLNFSKALKNISQQLQDKNPSSDWQFGEIITANSEEQKKQTTIFNTSSTVTSPSETESQNNAFNTSILNYEKGLNVEMLGNGTVEGPRSEG